MADYNLLVFSWNDIFPSRSQTGTSTDLLGETFTFGGGGDIVTYRDNDTFSGLFSDDGFTDNQIIGTIDGVSVNEALVNPEYAYTINDSGGNPVGTMYAITKNNDNLTDIEAFVFDFQPVQGETYTLAGYDATPSTSYSNLYVCFTAGTLIDTARGPVPVEDIRPGDQVRTRDNGLQTVEYVGSRVMSHPHLALTPKARPILIAAGALGPGMPARPLVVSSQHRVLVSSKIVERMTGQTEILIPAKKLLWLDGVDRYVPDTGVTYLHILCQAHELLVANGAFVESMFLGDQSVHLLGPEAQAAIEARCPGLAERMEMHPLARAGLAFRGKLDRLVGRHALRSQPIVQGDAAPF